MLNVMKEAGYDLIEMLKEQGHDHEKIWKWPFFYSKGRSDSVSLIGANIYPENLEDFIHKHHTVNDFKIGVTQSESQRPIFHVYLELRENIQLDDTEREALEAKAHSDILELLIENNEDFEQSYAEDPEVLSPVIEIFEHRSGPFANLAQKQHHVMRYTE